MSDATEDIVLELRITRTRRLERRGIAVDVAINTVGIEVDVFHVLRSLIVFDINSV